MAKKIGKYSQIIQEVFGAHYASGVGEFHFERGELAAAMERHGVPVKNLGDVLYTYRFRRPLPDPIRATEVAPQVWSIHLAGEGRYRFALGKEPKIAPDPDLLDIKIPDATPEIIEKHTRGGEQALLARVRYNRIIDIFTGITSYSVETHLQAKVADIGQIEIDELYVGVNRKGEQFVMPVQAKFGNHRINTLQTEQDFAFCRARYPDLTCRPIGVHQEDRGTPIYIVDFVLAGEDAKKDNQRRYLLVPGDSISEGDLKLYQNSGD